MTRSLPRQRDRGEAKVRRPWWRRGPAAPGGGFPPARSALGLRAVLALFGLVFCGVFAGLFAVRDQPAPAVLLALLALAAVVDLVVISRRRRERSG